MIKVIKNSELKECNHAVWTDTLLELRILTTDDVNMHVHSMQVRPEGTSSRFTTNPPPLSPLSKWPLELPKMILYYYM